MLLYPTLAELYTKGVSLPGEAGSVGEMNFQDSLQLIVQNPCVEVTWKPDSES